MASLAALVIYPVKSLRGSAIGAARVEPWGLEGDRRWLVVDPAGRFITQREVPRMATIVAHGDPDGVTLARAGGPPIRVAVPAAGDERLQVTVWRDTFKAQAAGRDADGWLSAALGRPCRLAYMDDPAGARPVDPDYAQAGDRVSFADGFPLLLACSGSLDDLNARLASPVPMERFRPNLVVSGAPPWAEDDWAAIRIADVLFDIVKPCARCIITTTDQATGDRDPAVEPIRTLQRFRRDRQGQVLFGQNLVPRSTGTVAAGDPVEVIRHG